MDAPSGLQFKILLHPGDEYLGSLEPESLQVLTYLKLANCLPHVTTESICYSSTPVLNHEDLPTATRQAYNIIARLKELGYDIDLHLTVQQRSEVLAYADLLTDRLLPAILYMQWVDTQNYLSITRQHYGKLLPFPVSLFYMSSRHNSAKHLLMRGAPLGCTLEEKWIELLGRATDCISLLSVKLGEGKYFQGDKPSSLDALVFGYLEVIGQSPAGNSNAPLHDKLKSCGNLLDFCRRIRKDCFPLMKERFVGGSGQPVPSQKETRKLWRQPAFLASVGMALLVLGVQSYRVGLFSPSR